MAMPTNMLLYPVMVLLLAYHQVLCYCSLAKPDSHTIRKNLVLQDYSYEIVYVDKNLVISLGLFASVFICVPRSSFTLTYRSHNLSSKFCDVAAPGGFYFWTRFENLFACLNDRKLMTGFHPIWQLK